MDYSPEKPVEMQTLLPLEARDTRGVDRLGEIQAIDQRYYAMPNIGDQAQVIFRAAAERPGMNRTTFLYSHGYYRLHLRGMGQPDSDMLQQIMTILDAAVRFAAVQFAAWCSGRLDSNAPR